MTLCARESIRGGVCCSSTSSFFLAYTSITGIVTTTTGKESIYSLEGYNCNAFKGEGFKYYIQGIIGVCNSSTPQPLDSTDCILWTNEEFWTDFQNKATGDYAGDASQDAKDMSSGRYTYYHSFYWSALATTFVRPIEVVLSVLLNGTKLNFFTLNLKNLIYSIVIFIWNFFTLLLNCFVGQLGGEDVTAQFIAENWRTYYGCESVDRTPLPALTKYTFSGVSLVFILLYSLPEIWVNFWVFLCCKNTSK